MVMMTFFTFQPHFQEEPILVFILGGDGDFYHFSAIFSGRNLYWLHFGGCIRVVMIIFITFNRFSAILSGRTWFWFRFVF